MPIYLFVEGFNSQIFPSLGHPIVVNRSVLNRPGQLAAVRPGRPKGRTAVFGQDGGPYRVRHAGAGQGERTPGDGRGRQGTVEDGGGWWGMVGDGGGW